MDDIVITKEHIAVALQLTGVAKFEDSLNDNKWIQYIPLAIDLLSERTYTDNDPAKAANTSAVSAGLKAYYASCSADLQGKIVAAMKGTGFTLFKVERASFDGATLSAESKEILQHFVGEEIKGVVIVPTGTDPATLMVPGSKTAPDVIQEGGYRQDGGAFFPKLKLSGLAKFFKSEYVSPYKASTIRAMTNSGAKPNAPVAKPEYSVEWDAATGSILLKHNGNPVKQDSITEIISKANALGFTLATVHGAHIADKCLGMGKSPLACLQQLDAELKAAPQDATDDSIRKANPLVLRDLLQAIDFKKNFGKKNGAIYYTYQSLDEYKASIDSSMSDLLNANPKLGKWISLAANHITNNFNSILNNSELQNAEPLRTIGGPFKYQNLPRFDPNNINNFNQLLLPQITNRNQSIARLVGFGGIPLVLGQRGGEQEGGSLSNAYQTTAFYDNILNFYKGQYKTMESGLQSFGKRIDDSTKAKMQATIDAFKQASENFGRDHALLLQYRNVTKQTPDNNYKPSEEHMRNVIKSLNNSVDVLNSAEINVVKVMNKLQGAIVQLVLKESGKQFAASD